MPALRTLPLATFSISTASAVTTKTDVNLIANGTAAQSTTLSATYAPIRAIDGFLNNFTHTVSNDPAPKWWVDVPANFPGPYVTGTFVPTQTSMFIDIFANIGGAQYNAIMVREIPAILPDPNIDNVTFNGGGGFDVVVSGLDAGTSSELRRSDDGLATFNPVAGTTFTGATVHTFTDPAPPAGTTSLYQIWLVPPF